MKSGCPERMRTARQKSAAAANSEAVKAGEEWPLRLPSFMTKFMATNPTTTKPR